MHHQRLKKNFILVAGIEDRLVKKIIEGPREELLSKKQLDELDRKMMQEIKELGNLFPMNMFDTVLAHVSTIEHLKREYPEFLGWQDIIVEKF